MPITIDFKGKLVLVTGGGRGIGLAITRAVAEAGADLAITYSTLPCSSLAASISSEFGITCRAFQCDVRDSKAVDGLVREVEEVFGREVDDAVCNAGIALWTDSHLMTDEELQNIFAVNTFAPFYLSRALFRSWQSLTASSSTPLKECNKLKNKHIVFVSSISGLVAMTPQNQSAYNASKAGLTMMGKSLAAEWAPFGVRVNMISPGYVATDMIANPPDEAAKAWVGDWEKRTPVGEFAQASQIGDFVTLILSDKAGGNFMTGSDLVIDGGYTLF